MCLLCPPSLCIRSRHLGTPVKIPSERLIRLCVLSSLSTSFFVALFSAIPGLRFLHHIFAFFFAASAAVWCSCAALFDHACAQAEHDETKRPWNRIRVKYFLCSVQIVCWISFGILWICLKLGWPYPFIPNKDGRFILLALFEYASTAALILFIHLQAQDLSSHPARVSLSDGESIPTDKVL
jgi:hypothetical protein